VLDIALLVVQVKKCAKCCCCSACVCSVGLWDCPSFTAPSSCVLYGNACPATDCLTELECLVLTEVLQVLEVAEMTTFLFEKET